MTLTTSACLSRPRAVSDISRPTSTSPIPQARANDGLYRSVSAASGIPRIHTPDSHTVGRIKCLGESDVMVVECCVAGCDVGPFGRWHEFKRHYDCTHAVARPRFWCPEPSCERSEAFGYDPFPRRDKMESHASSVHGLTPSRTNSRRRRNA